jgi:hypothetical protein
MAFRASLTYRDSRNNTAVSRMFIGGDSAAGITAVHTAAAALSNATVTDSEEAAAAPVAGTAGTYNDVEDRAIIVFQTPGGAIHRYAIMAPKSTIFLADQETVDFSGGVAAFVTAVLANVTNADGDNLASAVGGYRARVKMQRKFNIRTRNTTLTGQGL